MATIPAKIEQSVTDYSHRGLNIIQTVNELIDVVAELKANLDALQSEDLPRRVANVEK